MKNRIAVWDADFIPFYVCHNKDNSIPKTLEDCITDCDTLIKNINASIGCTSFLGFLTKGKCFRYSIYPAYKGNRKYDSLPLYLNEVKDHLEKEYGFIPVPYYEADDLVLSYKNQSEDECIIVSPDKDILNLEGTHYNPRKNEFVETNAEKATRYFWKSMMVGDTADNIKGISGIGPVSAEKILNNVPLFTSLRAAVLEEYCNKYGEEAGINSFYINYQCLKIVGNIPLHIYGDVKLNNVEELSE
jgi:5'-3' exonuclease